MKALCYCMPGLEYIDVPEPKVARPTDVKIKIDYASICGSDGHILDGAFDPLLKTLGKPPFLFGHEMSGHIVEMGDGCNVKGLKVGDNVVFYFQRYCGKCHSCRNGNEAMCSGIITQIGVYNDYMVVDEQQVYKLPADIGLREACLTEPVSVALRGVDRAEIKPGNSVAVFGASGIGLLTLQLARLSGGCRLTAIEPVQGKRDLAAKMGADHVLDPTVPDFMDQVKALTDGRGFDRVIECAGVKSAAVPAFEILAPSGILVYTSTHHYEYRMPLSLYQMFEKEAVIKGVYQSPYTLPRAVELLGRLNLKDVIAMEFPFDKGKEAFAEQKKGIHPKIIIKL